MNRFKQLLALAILGLVLGLPHQPSETLVTDPADGKLSLHDVHSGEDLEVRFLDKQGQPISEALDQINYFFRCRYTGQIAQIDLDLLKVLDKVQDHFDADKPLYIVSAYRSKKFNQYLLRKGRNVVPNSQHIHGRACDFRIPGVPIHQIRDYALSLKAGGVGYYPGLFVHLDTAQIRTW